MTTSDGSVQGTTQIFGAAPRNKAFNVVLLAEGFTAAEQSGFNTAAAEFFTALNATPPFASLTSFINVFRVNVTSTDSGADDPTAGGGTGATSRTYFDASFGAGNIRRALVCNSSTALQVAAAQVPELSLVLVVVNSPIYGGTGGSVGTYSLAAGATEIAIHESGHTAFGLADEYAYYAGGAETGHDQHPPVEPGEPNVTTNLNRGTLKWRGDVLAATALPTMSNPDCSTVDLRPSTVPVGTVGCFEGAHYYHCGAFRPEYNCKMRELSIPFCRICSRVITQRIKLLAKVTSDADLTGDGRADIVGFGDGGVWTALNAGDGTFPNSQLAIANFGYTAGGWRVDRHPRLLADLTGDGRADIIGFGDGGVWTALNAGDGTFPNFQLAIASFGYTAGGWRVDRHPRFAIPSSV
jgi:hypothetical protein